MLADIQYMLYSEQVIDSSKTIRQLQKQSSK